MKYKVGDKFIVEIESEYNSTYGVKLKNGEHEALSVGEKLLDQLQPMTETMTAEDAWETAKQILFKEELSTSMLEEIFGTRNHFAIMRDFTPQEAKAKIEAWEKSKEEIKVGDVLKGKDSEMLCVVTMLHFKAAEILWADGLTGQHNISEIRKQFEKTGTRIDVESFLKLIGE